MEGCSAAPAGAPAATSKTTADKITVHNLRIITSRFSAIKKAPFLAPNLSYKNVNGYCSLNPRRLFR
ncbi:hypothetical protein F1B88_14330 [Escherichia coli]|nr:hypothetical protein [Escherichia coli]